MRNGETDPNGEECANIPVEIIQGPQNADMVINDEENDGTPLHQEPNPDVNSAGEKCRPEKKKQKKKKKC